MSDIKKSKLSSSKALNTKEVAPATLSASTPVAAPAPTKGSVAAPVDAAPTKGSASVEAAPAPIKGSVETVTDTPMAPPVPPKEPAAGMDPSAAVTGGIKIPLLLPVMPAQTDTLVWPAITTVMSSFRAGLDGIFRSYQTMQDLVESVPAPEQRGLSDHLQGQLSLGQIESTKQRALDLLSAATAAARSGDALAFRLSPLFMSYLSGVYDATTRTPVFSREAAGLQPKMATAAVGVHDLDVALDPYMQAIVAAGKDVELLRFDESGNPYMIAPTDPKAASQPTSGPTKSGGAGGGAGVGIDFDFDGLRASLDLLEAEAGALRLSLTDLQATIDLIRAELSAMIADASALHGVDLSALQAAIAGTSSAGTQALGDAQANFADLRTWLNNLKTQADLAKAAVTHALTTLQSLVSLIQELRDLLDNRPALTSGQFAAWAQAVDTKIAEIEAAKAELDTAIPAARAALDALFSLLETGLQEAISRLTAGLAKIRDAVNAFNAWLQATWLQVKTAVEALQTRRDELMTPLFSRLDFRMTRVRCTDKQDPWTQSSRDEILLAHMAIGSSGVITSGTRYLGTFHPDGNGGHPAERTFSGGDSLVYQFGVPGSNRVANAYVMIVALYERDGSDGFASQWNSLASWLSTDLQTRLQNLHNPDSRAEILDKLKDWVMERVVARIFSFGDEEVLGVKVYPVLQWYPSMAFDRPSRAEMMSGLHWYIVNHPGCEAQLGAMSDDALLRFAIAEGVFFPALRQRRYTEIFSNTGKVSNDRVGTYEVDLSWDYNS